MKQSHIRNFSIVAHIDHGKSTLADRLLEATNTVEKRQMKAQLLDAMDLERERGITIKLNFVQLNYRAKNGEDYILHLIDTPGHVDFSYEVSRSLAACEGAILVVDAAQGIEAQTLANVYLAIENDLEIIPVINKIDLPTARPEHVKEEIKNVIGLDTTDIPLISAKSGLGIESVLEAVVNKIPAPKGDVNAPLQALVFDSLYDAYKGVIVSVVIKNGSVSVGDEIRFMANDAVYEVNEVGVYAPHQIAKKSLVTGEVGYLTAAIKSIQDVGVGDTITSVANPTDKALIGYRKLPSMVFCGLYPVESSKYTDLRDGLEKLSLNDSSLRFEPETSQALGFGYRCGFLGLLHMDVVQERLEREYGIELISTAPSVIFHVTTTDGKKHEIENPSQMPEQQMIAKIEEPFVKAQIIVPNEFIGAIMELCQKKRGIYVDMEVLDANRMNIIYELPLAEIVYDFFDQLKSQTKGYASLDYEVIGYRESKLVKMDILLNGEVVDALSVIVHREFAQQRGRSIVEKMRKLIPRHQFQIPIQAAIGQKIIARADISALRKNVLAKCYGGDISRKKKLLERQKEGKKRMKQVGRVEVPQEAFMSVLAMDDD